MYFDDCGVLVVNASATPPTAPLARRRWRIRALCNPVAHPSGLRPGTNVDGPLIIALIINHSEGFLSPVFKWMPKPFSSPSRFRPRPEVQVRARGKTPHQPSPHLILCTLLTLVLVEDSTQILAVKAEATKQ